MDNINSFKFSKTATAKPPDILNGKTVQEFLDSKYDRGCIFGLDILQHSANYKLSGWQFDFSAYLKLYLVKQHGNWQEYFAPGKTLLRRSLYGRVDKIVEVV